MSAPGGPSGSSGPRSRVSAAGAPGSTISHRRSTASCGRHASSSRSEGSGAKRVSTSASGDGYSSYYHKQRGGDQRRAPGGTGSLQQQQQRFSALPPLYPETTGGASAAAMDKSDFVHQPKRGIFYASELLQHGGAARELNLLTDEIGGLVENVCIIRFPPGVAAVLRRRLSSHWTANLTTSLDVPLENSPPSLGESGGEPVSQFGPLGLRIAPTTQEDYRLFVVEVEQTLGDPSSTWQLAGVLVELPCFIEALKSLEGELLFKANDIAQMLYVYDPKCPKTGPTAPAPTQAPVDLRRIRSQQYWEWHGGLSPGTHRIRVRKFKNYRVFDKGDVAVAEREICDIIGGRLVRETVGLEAVSEYDLELHLRATRGRPADSSSTVAGGDSCSSNQVPSLGSNVTAVIGPENPLLLAALLECPASEADAVAAAAQMGASLLRNHVAKTSSISLANAAMSERCRFNADAALVDEADYIRDDLSERLFATGQDDASSSEAGGAPTDRFATDGSASGMFDLVLDDEATYLGGGGGDSQI